ncbi:MAG TPA: BTAD domain-containing putative transcriptional regulator, partial [Bacillota bacterium]|nr:BTAD domain-containing putative transcriptional regulator [Bacillota bacterium]
YVYYLIIYRVVVRTSPRRRDMEYYKLVPKQERPIRVYTLGRFMVYGNDNIINNIQPKSQKLWDLFKYLLTHKGRNIPAEVILENLYPNADYEDPKNVVQNLIYRLRKLLRKALPFMDGSICIQYENGCYRLETSYLYIDVEDFTSLVKKGDVARAVNGGEAIGYYKRAVELYNGEYLPELLYMDWVVPIRNHYRRLYIQCCINLFNLLEKRNMNNDILRISEKVLLIEPFEECLHIYFLDALLRKNKTRQASLHYEYITRTFYNQFGIKPTSDLARIYGTIKEMSAQTYESAATKDRLVEVSHGASAYYCSQEVFHSIYTVLTRQSERKQETAYILSIKLSTTITIDKSLIDKIRSALTSSLRRGDVITRWACDEFLVLLSSIKEEGITNLKTRLEAIVSPCLISSDIGLEIDCQPLSSIDLSLENARVP